jgi:formylglycine-generating enzyme required for sulfatase activity
MGSPPDEPEREPWKAGTESPQIEVTIARPFAIGRLAVTRGEFAAFVESTGYAVEPGARRWVDDGWEVDPHVTWVAPGYPQGDDHPVVAVNWHDATAYVMWLATHTGRPYRLPSETEWEYAARAGTTTAFWWGPAISPAAAAYRDSREPGTVAADAFAPNPWGLYNVHGNVWQWCADCWNDSNAGNPGDGRARDNGDSRRRMVRGGSWGSAPKYLRSAYRSSLPGGHRFIYTGFRVACALD